MSEYPTPVEDDLVVACSVIKCGDIEVQAGTVGKVLEVFCWRRLVHGFKVAFGDETIFVSADDVEPVSDLERFSIEVNCD